MASMIETGLFGLVETMMTGPTGRWVPETDIKEGPHSLEPEQEVDDSTTPAGLIAFQKTERRRSVCVVARRARPFLRKRLSLN